MLLMIRTPFQHLLVLALFALCSVACLALGYQDFAHIFLGFTGGALSIGRKEPETSTDKKDAAP